MKIYIAGKITGLEYEDAEAAFVFAETVLEKAGHTPLNPLKLVDQFGDVCECGHHKDHHIENGEVDCGICVCELFEPKTRDYWPALFDALRVMLERSEGVYFLANWRDSMGARIEHAIAVELKMPIFYAASELPVGSDWPEKVSEVAAV